MSTQEILTELQTLVGQELQPVSYKWLARRFALPSNVAKQTLFAFLEQHQGRVKATYLLSGWMRLQPRQHVVQLVDAAQLTTAREALQPVTSMHVYSVQPAQPKDLADLWNSDHLQAGELFKEMLQQGNNCLADNRGAKRDPKLVRQLPTAAAAAPASAPCGAAGKAPGLKGSSAAAAGRSSKPSMTTKLNGILAGKTAEQGGMVSASVAVRTNSDAGSADAEAPELAGQVAAAGAPAPSSSAAEPAGTTAGQRPASGAAKASPGSKAGTAGKLGRDKLASMWTKAPPRKPAAPAAAQPAAAKEAAGKCAAGPAESDSDDDMQPAAKRTRVEGLSRPALAHTSPPEEMAGLRRPSVLDESDDDDLEAPTAPLAGQPRKPEAAAAGRARKQPAKQAAASRAKRTSAAAKAADKRSTAQAAPAESSSSEDEEVQERTVELDDLEPEAEEGVPLRSGQRAVKPTPIAGSVKAGAPSSGPKRRKVMRTSYNDKGEEVTEEVIEEELQQQGEEEARNDAMPQTSASASPPKQYGTLQDDAGNAPKGSAAKPNAKVKASGGAKSGGAKAKQIAGQRGIASFFGKKQAVQSAVIEALSGEASTSKVSWGALRSFAALPEDYQRYKHVLPQRAARNGSVAKQQDPADTAGTAASAAASAAAQEPGPDWKGGATTATAWMFPWEKRQMGGEGTALRTWERWYWGVFVMAIVVFLFNRLRGSEADDKVDEAKEQAKAVAARAVLAGRSFTDGDNDPFEGLSPRQIQAYIEEQRQELGTTSNDPFEGMSPEEINDYVVQQRLTTQA